MMTEAQVIAEKLGIKFRHTIEKRLEGAEAVGPHKTSMLQDLEEGRPLEREALVGSILEMGRLADTGQFRGLSLAQGARECRAGL